MNSPGIKYKDKVFAFFHNDEMIFRLGKDFDPHKFGLREVKLLNPFKNKGPLKGWFVVNRFEKEKWEDLTRKAFEYAKSL